MNLKAIFALTSFAVVAFAVPSASPPVYVVTIETPVEAISTCGRAVITFKDGQAPFFVTAHNASSSTYDEIASIAGPTRSRTIRWRQVTIPAGTQTFWQVRDAIGNVAQTGAFTVQAGTTNNCLEG